MAGLAPVGRKRAAFDDREELKGARGDNGVTQVALNRIPNDLEQYDVFIEDTQKYQQTGFLEEAVGSLNNALLVAERILDPHRSERLIRIIRMYRTLGYGSMALKVLQEKNVFESALDIKDAEFKLDQLTQIGRLSQELGSQELANLILEYAREFHQAHQQSMDVED